MAVLYYAHARLIPPLYLAHRVNILLNHVSTAPVFMLLRSATELKLTELHNHFNISIQKFSYNMILVNLFDYN
jgi:hypothetical protein